MRPAGALRFLSADQTSTIGPNVLEYIPSSAKLPETVQTGEAAIFPLTPTAVATQKARGVPMEYAQPKEG